MPIKDNTNKTTEIVEMALESTAAGLSAVSLVNPAMALVTPLFNIAALPTGLRPGTFHYHRK